MMSSETDGHEQKKKSKKNTKTRSKPDEQKLNGVTWRSLIRHTIFIILVAATAGTGFIMRDDLLQYLGWSLVPLGFWVAVFTYLVIVHTTWIAGRTRETLASLIITLAGCAALGIFNAPLGAMSGPSMGGLLGEYLAREPFEWDRYNVALWQQIIAWIRVIALFALGAWASFPSGFNTIIKIAAIGIMVAVSSSIKFIASSTSALFAKTSKAAKANKLNQEQEHQLHNSPETENDDYVPDTSEPHPATATFSNSIDTAVPQFTNEPLSTTAQSPQTSRRVVIGMGESLYSEPNLDTDAILAEIDSTAENDEILKDLMQYPTIESNPQPQPDPQTQSQLEEEPPPGQTATAVADPFEDEEDAEDDHDEETSQMYRAPNGMVMETDTQDPDETQSEELLNFDDDYDFDGIDLDELNIEDVDIEDLRQPEEDIKDIDESFAASALEQALNDFTWHLPTTDFMPKAPGGGLSASEIEDTSKLIEESLAQHGVEVTVDQVRIGPTITMYGLKPGWKGGGPNSKTTAQRVRVDTILNREKDLALALKCPNIRFESVVPGASVVGIEVPNATPTPVNLRSIMDTQEWAQFAQKAALPVPMGIGSGGEPIMADFATMPHTLVAGATGSGKSVCMNTIVAGLLLSRTPMEVRMVMIDPKRVELTPYQGIPHLYSPVVVDPEKAVTVLKALTKEMMERFATLEAAGVKNISSYNQRASMKMPYLLILVDELADLMLTASNDVEQLLVRLAQLGRATGVHLVVATQRPSVDVVTGLIKANFPSRVSFSVMSQVDSRTILDSNGAEKLLGKGDMLYKPIDLSKPVRVQGAYLSEEEIETKVEYWKNAGSPPLPKLEIDENDNETIPGVSSTSSTADTGDLLFDSAIDLASNQKTLSTSLLQRRLKIGYPRAARLMDELEEAGIVGPGEPGKPRQVL